LPINTSIILHVGHLRSGRNLDALIPLARQPGLTVVVAASHHQSAETPHLRQTLTAAGVVILESYFPNIDELYRLADCYVFPTQSTDSAIATPLSILEAMASNLPVASMRMGALAERFGNSDSLRLVDTADELVAAVLQLVAGRTDTTELDISYSWDAIAGRLVRLIDEATA
jgi:glycosyltransferase involved in cell wall biosynthesis